MRKIIIAWFLAWLLVPLVTGAQTIQMRIPDSTMILGSTLDVPVYADNTLTGENVLSYVLQLSFNQSYLQVISVFTNGTISAAFGAPAVNTASPGLVTIAGAGSSALTGSGKFIYIRFKSLLPGSSQVTFTGVQNNYFNEGLPAMTFDPGLITVPTPAVVTVSPNTGNITKGETLQFSAGGGTAPYTWSVTNPAVASINSTGLLTGVQHGWTRVVAVSSQGLRDTTNGEIEIRPMKLSIPSNLSQLPGTIIDIPVNTTDLTGLGIISGNFSITFNPGVVVPLGIQQSGTLLSAYGNVLFNISQPGQFHVDFAGTTPLTGSGTLLYLRFQVPLPATGATALNFSNGIFNEDLIPNFTSGYLTILNLPTLSITPSTGTMVAGETKQFTVNGGPALPLTWSVSDPTVASISTSGLLTSIKGGNITVTVHDANGAAATSGNWLIYDTRVIMPDTTTCPSAQIAYYPIRIANLPSGQSVTSVQGTVTFSSAYLTFLELYNPGSLTQGWTWATNATASQVIFAGSGTTPFSGSGVIVYLKFQLKPAFVAGTTAALQLPSILLNEGTPNPLVDVNGYILGSNTLVSPSVSVVGSANPVLSGVPVTFTATPVNGGVSPAYQWRVNSVNVSGATSSVYTYSPANNDQVSCVMTSSSLCVNPVQATSNVITMSVTGLPANLNVNGTVGNLQSTCYNATQTITVAGNNTTFLVNSGGSATFIAGQWIRFLPGTRVFSGGYLTGKIAPGGPWCNAKSAVALTGEKENAPLVTDQRQGLTLYPNPSTGLVTLKIPESVFTEDPIQLCVFGLQGNQLISQQLSADNPLRVDLTHLPAGIYFVQVRQGSLINKGKVIKTD